MSEYNYIITERGNGFPSDGEYILDDSGEILLVINTSQIHTQSSGSGNYVYAECEEQYEDDDEYEGPEIDEICSPYDVEPIEEKK